MISALCVCACMKIEFGISLDASADLEAVKQKHLNEICATQNICGLYSANTSFPPPLNHFNRQVAANCDIITILVLRNTDITRTHRLIQPDYTHTGTDTPTHS